MDQELRIPGEDQEAVLFGEHAFGDELFALGHDIGIVLGRCALLQDGGGAAENDETIYGTLASPLGTFDTAVKHATGLRFRSGLSNRREDIGAEDGRSCRIRARNTSMSSRSDSGSFAPPA